MGVLEELKGAVVGLDTAPLIYFIDEKAPFHDLVRPFFEALAEGRFTVVTSTITLIETLVHPLRNRRDDLANQYKAILLNSAHLTTFDVSPDIAQKAAEIRAHHQIRTPDAIQLATALHCGATHFLTNDGNLKRFHNLNVLVVDDLA